ncbi:MAG: S1 family peptidase [Defluviitaleaceae bacterium]|nr:S1 family peptidase [Defluviitaleaceae bacterium]
MKKAIQRVVSFMLVIIFATSMTVFGVEDALRNDDIPDLHPDFAELMLRQVPALEAHEALYQMFTVNDDGTVTYPDDFAGVWIEDSKYLYIAIVTSNLRNMSAYGSTLAGHEDVVVFVEAAHSLNELTQLRDEVFNMLQEASLPVVSGFVDMEGNRVILSLKEFDNADDIRMIDNFNALSLDMSDIIYLETIPAYYFKETESQATESQIEPSMLQRTLVGGQRIYVNGVPQTLGANGSGRFITSGHWLNQGDIVRPTAMIGQNGVVERVIFGNGSNGDFAVIRVDSGAGYPIHQSNIIRGGTNGGNRNITGITSNAPVGTLVSAFGQASGYVIGTVFSINTTFTASGITINGVTSVSLLSGSTTFGDSGAPWHTFTGQGNNWNLSGVHTGRDNWTGRVYFTPTVRFINHFTPLTSPR